MYDCDIICVEKINYTLFLYQYYLFIELPLFFIGELKRVAD